MKKSLQKLVGCAAFACAGIAMSGCEGGDASHAANAVTAGGAAAGMINALGAGSETGAVGTLRAIVSGQTTFAVTCANGGYAQAFADLVKPPRGSSAAFIPPDLAADGAVRSGYAFTMRGGAGAAVVMSAADTCNGSDRDAVSSFFAEGHPADRTLPGRRSFAVDERGKIYVRADGEPITPGMAGAADFN